MTNLHSFTEIFDEKFYHSKYGKKENWTNTGKNKQEKAGSQSHNTACHHQSVLTKYDSSSLQGCGAIFDEKVLRNYGRKDGRKDGRNDGQM